MAAVRVQGGAEGHPTECHSCPTPQRGTPGMELWEKHLCHPKPLKSSDS